LSGNDQHAYVTTRYAGVGTPAELGVYVAELARRLGERGLKVDVFTRRDSPDLPDIVEVHEHTRVINLKAGPAAYVARRFCRALAD
jgi:D-inositol-3-phosphate glycosyltransferase